MTEVKHVSRSLTCFIQNALRCDCGSLRRAMHSGRVKVALEGKLVAVGFSIGPQVVTPIKRDSIDVQ
jgi:hypothetical protein